MAATSTGHRAAIMREVEAELNRIDQAATAPPTFGQYASDVARRLITLANNETAEVRHP